MRFVAIKTAEQQVIQAEHRIRARLIKSRTALSNEIRGLLAEFGIVVATSIGRLRKALPELLEDGENGLPGSFRVLLAELGEELRALDDSITAFDARIAQAAREDDRIRRLLEVEGIVVRSLPVRWSRQWATAHSLIVAGTCLHGLV